VSQAPFLKPLEQLLHHDLTLGLMEHVVAQARIDPQPMLGPRESLVKTPHGPRRGNRIRLSVRDEDGERDGLSLGSESQLTHVGEGAGWDSRNHVRIEAIVAPDRWAARECPRIERARVGPVRTKPTECTAPPRGNRPERHRRIEGYGCETGGADRGFCFRQPPQYQERSQARPEYGERQVGAVFGNALGDAVEICQPGIRSAEAPWALGSPVATLVVGVHGEVLGREPGPHVVPAAAVLTQVVD